MNSTTQWVLFWAPRILSILFAIFLSLFALDILELGYGLWEMILALMIHLVPTYIIVIVLIVAWRWEWIGAILFGALAILYLVQTWERLPLASGSCIWGPLILIGVLFLLNWKYKPQRS